MRALITAFAIILLGLAAVLGVGLLRLPAAVGSSVTATPLAVDADAAAARLAAAVRIATVSPSADAANDAAFAALAALLRSQYPRVHATLGVETVGAHGLLYRWAGRDASLPPVLMLAHQDVVPVDGASRWQHAPFSGDIADGYIWGRGTLDDKGSLIAQLEAVEALLAQGYVPRRTLYFAFGHDEESGGDDGAGRIAALLKDRGIRARFAVDEGGAITRGVVAGVSAPVASIMVAEKGYVSFELRTHERGGHSSMPPAVTAIGRLARAVARLEAQPMPAHLTPATATMLETLAPRLPFVQRLAIANRWLFEPLLLRQFARQPVTDALIRTTTAPTVFRAGVKDNVLPGEALAIVNFRLLPGDTIADVERHIVGTIADPAVDVRAQQKFANEASPASDGHGPGFALLRDSIAAVYPDAVTVPGLVVGATDLRHYAEVVDERCNFLPGRLDARDLERIHGTDERIAVSEFAGMVRFYADLLRRASAS
ncbi:M20/M25/M40 family metallo-hydrolase [Solimonas soli]|uniref:M20/M25/M40 family metallo-hydrolase n=1 Tax=Solimonas soli TaxID=413479 RepID=UPI0004BCE925|nr:M20/M25/M40 family metallo-hydrolase [Solimonas soli]